MQYQNEGVDHPKHYRHRSGLDAIVWIDRFNLDFSIGSCFKYLFRGGFKDGESIEKDHEKAIWYFRHEVERLAKYWEPRYAEQIVFGNLKAAFGPPGRKLDENGHEVLDWTTGGCDMPDAIEFLKEHCMNAMKD